VFTFPNVKSLVTVAIKLTEAAADAGVGAPSEAWCALRGESLCPVWFSQPPVSSVACMAEITLNCGMQVEAHARTWEALYFLKPIYQAGL